MQIPHELALAFQVRDIRAFDLAETHLLQLEDRAEPRDWAPTIRLREALVFCGLEHFSKAEKKVHEATQSLVLKCNAYAMNYFDLRT